MNYRNKQQALVITEQSCCLMFVGYVAQHLLLNYSHDMTYLIFILRNLDNTSLADNRRLINLIYQSSIVG